MWRLVAVALLALPVASSIALAEDMKLPPQRNSPPERLGRLYFWVTRFETG